MEKPLLTFPDCNLPHFQSNFSSVSTILLSFYFSTLFYFLFPKIFSFLPPKNKKQRTLREKTHSNEPSQTDFPKKFIDTQHVIRRSGLPRLCSPFHRASEPLFITKGMQMLTRMCVRRRRQLFLLLHHPKNKECFKGFAFPQPSQAL